MKRIFLFLATMLAITGCNNHNDEFSLDRFVVRLVTVENPNNESSFYLITDDTTRLWTAASNLKYYRPQSGQRLIANYTLLNKRPESSDYQHDIKLNDVYEVLTKDIFDLSPATQDSIGNDPLYIEDIWIGSNFLNVEFIYAGSNKTHFITLAADNSTAYTDGKVHLEFRHNANNDYPAYNRRGIVSFNLNSLKTQSADTVQIAVHTKQYDIGNKIYDLNFLYGTPTNNSRPVKIPIFRAIVE